MESLNSLHSKSHCLSVLGLVIVGYLAFRAVKILLIKEGFIKSIDSVVKNVFDNGANQLNSIPRNPPVFNRFDIENHDKFNPRHLLLRAGLPEDEVPFVPRVGSFLFAYHKDQPHAHILLQHKLQIEVSQERIKRLVDSAYLDYPRVKKVFPHLLPDRLPDHWEVSASVSVYGPLAFNDYGVFFQGWLFDNTDYHVNLVGLTLIHHQGGVEPMNHQEFIQENVVHFF